MHLYVQLPTHVQISMNTCMLADAGRIFLTRNAYKYKGFKLPIWGEGRILTYLHELYLLNRVIVITGNLEFFFLRCGTCYFKLYSLQSNFSDSVFPMYKSTKSAAAARVRERPLMSCIIITRISILPSCNSPPPPSYLQKPSPSQLSLCPGLQAAGSSCLPQLHHHRKR